MKNSRSLTLLVLALSITIHWSCKARKQQAEFTAEAVEETVEEVESVASEAPDEALPMEEEDTDEVLTITEEMPMYPGCKAFTVYRERKACADNKFYQYTLNNLQYPPIAVENGVQGTVVIGFTVNKDGTRSNVRIMKDIGYGCGTAALELVNSMPLWEPGLQNGKPVAVRYQLPVTFRLK